MSDQYYIRIRGEVKGPLTHEQIAAQIRRKRLGKHHELSTDAVTWQKAGDMPEFFQSAVAVRERAVEIEPEPIVQEAAFESTAQLSDEGDAEEQWFYTKSGNKLGPVSASEIQMWLSSGRLSGTDLVWRDGFDNWIAASELPQFSSASKSGKRSSSKSGDTQAAGFWEVFMGTSHAAGLPADAIHKFPNLSRYLRIAESSLRVMFVLMLFLNLAGWLYAVGQAVNAEDWQMVAGLVISGPLGVLLMWLVFLTFMALLELVRVVIKIEDNTSR